MRRMIVELVGIAGLVIVATLISQLLFPNRIPFFTRFTTIETDNGPMKLPAVLINHELDSGHHVDSDSIEFMTAENPAAITTAETYEAFQAKRAVIIDARDSSEYANGHIQGAWHVPYTDLLQHVERFDRLPPDTLLITYCDGEDCLASMELANQLAAMGFSRVRYYFGGWNSWQNHQYPVTTEATP